MLKTLALMLLSVGFVQGDLNMSRDVFLGDNFFDYKVNTSEIILDNLTVTRDDLFLDDVPFCDSVDRGLFFTIRDCDGLRNWEPAVVLAGGLPIIYLMMMIFRRRKDE